MSSLSIDYLAYFYSVFPLHPNTFHRLFQHSTQPQLDQLKTLITEFNKLQGWIGVELRWLYLLIVYLGWIAYEIFLHLLSFGSYIIGFNVLEAAYINLVKASLVGFMNNIKKMMVKRSIELLALMNILILHFCAMINYIFAIIKAKLLFYLLHLELEIYVDYALLIKDLKSFNDLLLDLQLLITRYKLIFEKVSILLTTLKTLLSKIPILKSGVSIIDSFNKVLSKLLCKLKSICSSCDKFNRIFGLLNKEILSLVVDLQGSSINIKVNIKDKSERKVTASIMNINVSNNGFQKYSSKIKNMLGIIELSDIGVLNGIIPIIEQVLMMEIINNSNSGVTVSPLKFHLKLISDFRRYVESIKKLMEMTKMFDLGVLKEIMSIKEQFLKVETINLIKLNLLIKQIQNLYLNVIIRAYLLICTILFYNEINQTIARLSKSMEFNCCNCHRFLAQCSEVENYITKFSSSINECITKLREASNSWKSLGVRKELKDLFKTIIDTISRLKFYVDLMMLEILIFKTIIMNLIVMRVSSFYLDKLILEIVTNIKKVEDAITRLIAANVWLRAFYLIQLQNTMTIFALSSALKFSDFIHDDYFVLFLNLYLINGLIWVIECCIQHLIVFKHVSTNLNSLKTYIGDQFKVINDLGIVAKSMATITDKLISINKSITQLKTISGDASITNWKESAQVIRDQIKSINTNLNEFNSEITEINKNADEIIKSLRKLLEIYYFLLVLILQVMVFIEDTNKYKSLSMEMGNKYYRGLIVSVMEPCNKQLIFILGYLSVMTVVMRNLIKIVKETILLIYKEMGLLSSLTKILKDHVDNIDRGILDVECAIEGVALNFIKCTIKSLSTNLTIINRANNNRLINDIGDEEVDNQVVSMYSVLSVNQYEMVVNRMLEFWTFCDESVELFKYIRYCACAFHFESRYRAERPSTFPYSLQSIRTSDTNPVSELVRHIMSENMGNHLCLCLVIKYHLRPSLLKCILYLRNEELGTLDTISRKFQKYNALVGVKTDLWKLCALILNIIYELTSLLRNRYNFVWIGLFYPVEIKCFCTDTNTIDYHYILTISLYLSSLMENIWSMDTESLRMSIECLSTLYSQLEIYDLSSVNNPKKLSCNSIYTLLLNKQCQEKDTCQCKGKDKCCCCCSIIVNVLMIYISLCLQCKLCKVICNNKDKTNGCKIEDWKKFCEVVECKCTCAGKDNGLCCLLKLALCSQVRSSGSNGCEELNKKLEQCCKQCTQQNGCCKILLDKVKAGLCKLLLLGCCCNDAKCGCPEGSGDDVKVKCLLFGNECNSVALVVFCKCGEQAKGCCGLTTLIEKCQEQLKKLFQNGCKEQDCCCKELKSICEQLCCGTDCTDCVCEQLKSSCTQIFKACNGPGGNNCLCKLIKQCLEKLCSKKNCECKDKGCCRCGWCKVVAQGVRILTRACRANVLEPYKRIAIGLLNSTKNKKDVIRTIVGGINGTTLNNIYLVKNSHSSYPYSVGSYTPTINRVTNVETRNWGYDTKYEHDVSTDKGFSNQYPYVTNPDNRESNRNVRSNKAFKMILSRLLVGGVIVFVFVYIRLTIVFF